MVEQQSPLEPVWKPGAHGKVLGGAGVVFEETQPGSIVQAAAADDEARGRPLVVHRADRDQQPVGRARHRPAHADHLGLVLPRRAGERFRRHVRADLPHRLQTGGAQPRG